MYLGSLGVEYKPWTAIKGQVLVEFLAEFQYDPNNPSSIIPAEAQLDLVTGRWELLSTKHQTLKVQEQELC